MADRKGLSFGPFERLSEDELRREERYWFDLARESSVGVAIIADRHRQRCLEVMHGR